MKRNRPTIAIFRYGSNAANQSMCQRALVALIIGTTDYERARSEAAKAVTVYNNQHLAGKALSDLTALEREELESGEEDGSLAVIELA